MKPAGFCVHGCAARTNNFVESHNARLATNIPHRSSFYVFVGALLVEENRKTHDFLQGQTMLVAMKRRNAANVKRDKRIAMAQEELASGTIGLEEFLNKIIFPTNGIIRNLTPGDADVVDVADEDENVSDASSDEEDDVEPVVAPLAYAICIACKKVLILSIPAHLVCNECGGPVQAVDAVHQ